LPTAIIWLMIAGLGNVYTDEILFQAGIHPQTKASSIKAEALEELFQVMREDVLPTVIGRRADPSQFPAGYLIPHRERGGHCPKCGNALKRTKISGRTTYLCPNHQKK
jgi:formamidopyrimidine-DNA glycosylase